MPGKISLYVVAFISILSPTLIASDLGYKPGELIVRFSSKENGKQRTLAEQNEVLASINAGTIKHSYKLVPGLTLVKLQPDLSVEKVLPLLKNAGGILYAEPNYRIKALADFPDDPNFPQLWGMHNTGQTGGTGDADIDAPEAWNIATDSDIIVAVIDSGVDYNHPDLALNMWINPGEDHPPLGIVGPEDFDGVNDDGNTDGDGNPLIDDIYGYDFCEEYGKPRDSDPMDDFYHGTHCAGIIGAVGNNSTGVTGVCWNVKIMAVKFLDSYGFGYTDDAIASIEYAVQMGAKVLSNSWGGEYSQALKNTIESADANGVLFIASAGNPYYYENPDNDTSPRYPASYDCDNIIAVMATDHNDLRSIWFGGVRSSAYGAESVDLSAPGSEILSTFPTYMTDAMYEYGLSTDYEILNGTSMATPHVAGACALIWSANPSLNHLQVKQIILNTVDKLEGLDGLCVTGGRLNLYKAVLEATKNEQILSKIDNANGTVLPDDEITYTIYYANPVTDPNDPNYLGDLNNVIIVDYLPEEVDYNSSDPCGIYNPTTRTVFWDIGTLAPDEDSNTVTLTVIVNDLAAPMGTITNVCVLDANEINLISSLETTDVNAWNPGIIYVSQKAGGSNTGMSWNNAYTSLQSALQRARHDCGNEIWVASGIYKPTTNTIDPNWYATFHLVDGVPLYGGFAGNETSRCQRNWVQNQTILDGTLGDYAVRYVVTSWDVNEATVVDGFIITKGFVGGIYCDGASPTITHNTIKQNSWGIDCENNSSPDIKACSFKNNNTGIACYDSAPTITRCIICDNYGHGFYGVNSPLRISNCMVWNNQADGIYLNTYAPMMIRNNTIINNVGYGISLLYYPENANISNCIIRGNTSGSFFTYSGLFDVNYSCIEGGYDGEGNIDVDPLFYNDPNDPNNFHLASNSPCIDEGNPTFTPDPNETDIDGEDRVKDGDADANEIVDMGADEYYLSPADFYTDLMVNFLDYARFALHWQSSSGEPDYNDIFDLEDNNSIDYADLALFCEDWLWQAGWTKEFTCGAGQGMSRTMAAGFIPAEVSYPSISPEQQIEKAEPLKIEQLIDWLEQLWLDEEVQKLIDEDVLLKFIESLKE